MPYDLFIPIARLPGLGPTLGETEVMVQIWLEELTPDHKRSHGTIDIQFVGGAASPSEIAEVMRSLTRFFESEQFRSIDFEKGEMFVEKEGTLVSAKEGILLDDGKVVFAHPVNWHP